MVRWPVQKPSARPGFGPSPGSAARGRARGPGSSAAACSSARSGAARPRRRPAEWTRCGSRSTAGRRTAQKTRRARRCPGGSSWRSAPNTSGCPSPGCSHGRRTDQTSRRVRRCPGGSSWIAAPNTSGSSSSPSGCSPCWPFGHRRTAQKIRVRRYPGGKRSSVRTPSTTPGWPNDCWCRTTGRRRGQKTRAPSAGHTGTCPWHRAPG